MKRLLLSAIMVVIGLSAFSQSPSRLISFRPAYPLSIGENAINGIEISNNGLYMYDILQDSLPRYEIGQIFEQTVRYAEEGYGFYIKADSLHSINVEYGYEVNEPPQGSFEFNETTGRFKYYPAPDDYKSFVVTFYATNGTESVSEDVVFKLMPKTPSEDDAFNTKGTMPDAGDYTIFAETSTKKHLNCQDRTAYSISISGKDIIFDDAVQNKVWGLNGREDIYELNIYAERLIVRSALLFPQTNITIYAKELVLEDKGNEVASINTTASPEKTLTDGQGANGEDAGNITLYIKEFKGNLAIRFIANGAKGQSANRNGIPGNGGNGGIITSTIDVSNYCDFARGSGGMKYDVAGSGSTNAGPVIALGAIGNSGHFEMNDNSYAYLHPYYISAVMRHVNDAFINNQTEYALQTCREYRTSIDEYLNSGLTSKDDEGPHEGEINDWDHTLGSRRLDWQMDNNEADHHLEFHNCLLEIEKMLFKLEQGLDYFGNSVGWVPLLSFEVMLANYNNEIDRAIPTLYMYYWLNRIDQTLQNKVKASQFAASETEKEIEKDQEFLNSLVLEIPVLQDEADELNAMIVALTQRIEALQNQLMAQAKKNVKKRSWLQKLFGVGKAIANVIPVFGNVASTISSGLDFALDAANLAVHINTGIDYSSVMDGISKECDSGFLASISTGIANAKTSITQKDYKSLSDACDTMYNKTKPLFSNINKAYDVLSQNSAPNSKVQEEYNRLIASSPEWNNMKAQVDELNTKKMELLNHINEVFSNITNTMSELSNDALALDAFRRDAFTGNSKRDLNAMLYLAKMEQRAKSRLLLYDYYLRKAYEYRLLKPYEGEYNLVSMFERFQTIAQAGDSVIDRNAYETLGSVFRERISDMTNLIMSNYSNGTQEQTASITIAIPKEQLDAINAGENVALNFHEMGVFSPEEENVRIVDLGVEYMDKHVEGNIGYSGRMDLQMTHSGISQFRKEGQLYWFDHMSRTSANPHTWGVRYDAKTQKTNAIQPSAASSSLLYSILKSNSDDAMLFSRPSAWSDITLSKKVQTTGGADIIIDSLLITLQYDFTYRPNSIRNIDISTNEELLPYIACSEEDVNGRSHGKGRLYRSYRTSSKSITFTAIDKYETYYFMNWTDRSGKIISDKTELTINRSKDQFYIANYERRVPILNVADTIVVTNEGGLYTIHVSNIGSGDTEMDWYVSDSLSTWAHVDGVAEGIDEGAFTITCEANPTSNDRIDSILIFAPETDAMSKVIIILQSNDYDDNHPTGIHEVVCDVDKAPIFNLRGQRVIHPSKGIYVRKGKKLLRSK